MRLDSRRDQSAYTHGADKLSLRTLSAGTLSISWYLVPKGAHLSAAKPVLIASGEVRFTHAGRVTIASRLTPKGRRLLKSATKLKLSAKGVYGLTGGKPIAEALRATMKLNMNMNRMSACGTAR